MEIEVLQKSESFRDVDGAFTFLKTRVVYQQKNAVYLAFSKLRYKTTKDIKLHELEERTKIPTGSFCPIFDSELRKLLIRCHRTAVSSVRA